MLFKVELCNKSVVVIFIYITLQNTPNNFDFEALLLHYIICYKKLCYEHFLAPIIMNLLSL